MNKPLAAAVVAGSLLAGAGIGAAFFGPGPAGAQSTSSDTSSSSDATGSTSSASPTAPTSNEDQAHETNETPEQEAAEDSGKARHGAPHGPGGHPNEDPAHESTEDAAREAAEAGYCARARCRRVDELVDLEQLAVILVTTM
jgi:hypothetical protein